MTKFHQKNNILSYSFYHNTFLQRNVYLTKYNQAYNDTGIGNSEKQNIIRTDTQASQKLKLSVLTSK